MEDKPQRKYVRKRISNLPPATVERIRELWESGLSAVAISKELEIADTTVYRLGKKLGLFE